MKSLTLDRFISRFLFSVFVTFSVFGVVLATLVATSATGHAATKGDGYNRATIKRMVIEEARANEVVPVGLALAVAKVESDFQADVESHAGARGVMQIMPATARGEFGVHPKALWRPRTNIRLGITYLEQLYYQYGKRWDLALSHYNGGTLKGGKGANAKPHSYTRKYVADVKRHWRKYSRIQVAMVAKQVKNQYEKQEQTHSVTGSPAVASSYWLLEEDGVEKNWRDYLKEADRILEGKDQVVELEDFNEGRDVAQVPDWYEHLYEEEPWSGAYIPKKNLKRKLFRQHKKKMRERRRFM